MHAQRWLTVPVWVSSCMALGLNLITVLGCWHFLLKDPWQFYALSRQHAQMQQQNLQQSRHQIAQIPVLQRDWQNSHRLNTETDFGQRIAMSALAHGVWLTTSKQVDNNQWQVNALGSLQQLELFLQELLATPSTWAIQDMRWEHNPLGDAPIQLQLRWQSSAAVPILSLCTTTSQPRAGIDPFQVPTALNHTVTQYSLAEIQWLGVIQDQWHVAALLRLPDQQLVLTSRGDVVGREHWQLTELTRDYVVFNDSQNNQHRLALPVELP